MIFGDYHTHTVYSHGKGSVEENVNAAAEVGLKEIAITDHGFLHRIYNVRRMDWAYLKRDISEARIKFPKLKVLLGMEANLMDSKGTLDIEKEDLEAMDVLICGFHKFSHSTSMSEIFKFSMPVFFSDILHKSSAKRLAANTDAYIRAMEKYPVDIISHPNLAIKVDLRRLAEAAAHYGVYLELNGKKVSFSPSEAEIMLREGAEFMMDSDAHSPSRVGEISTPLQFVREAHIPFDRIVNWEKLPVFKKKREFSEV